MMPEALTDNNPCHEPPSRPIEGELKFSTLSTTGPWSSGTSAELVCKQPYISQGEVKSICLNGMFSPLGECVLPQGQQSNPAAMIMPMASNNPMMVMQP